MIRLPNLRWELHILEGSIRDHSLVSYDALEATLVMELTEC